MSEELKPCPLCGNGDAPFVITEDRTWIECGDCTSRVVLGPFDTEAEAITAWNQRTPDPRIAELEAAIRECEVTFRFYEQQHLAKKTQDGDEKAYRNKQMADKCRQALKGPDHDQ